MELDRCDRCGAAGQSRFVLDSGLDLVFCGHHTREYENKLMDIAIDMSFADELVTA